MATETGCSPFRLDGEVALITGGGTGLGLAMARRMADAGAKVILIGQREPVLAKAVATIGAAARYEVHNVRFVDAAPHLVARATRHFGPVSALVNNAGIHLKKPVMETSEAELMHVFNTHVTGAFALCRAAAPAMLQQGHGSILFTASMASLFGIPQVAAYTVAKSAYVGLVRALAVELSPHGVRVNAIAPGWIESPMMRKTLNDDPQRKQKILDRTPLGRFGTADDIGNAAVYLCSDAAQFVTGVILPIDGGVSIGF
jgi:NAD(P)-dependent dehydrogenase (short-subunit alcohol dehydrogenase family)